MDALDQEKEVGNVGVRRTGLALGQLTPEAGGTPAVLAGSEPSRPGAFRVEGTALYVSRGLGTVRFPLRFLCRPELAILTLRRRET